MRTSHQQVHRSSRWRIALGLSTVLLGSACTLNTERADKRCRVIGKMTESFIQPDDKIWFDENCLCDTSVERLQATIQSGGRMDSDCFAPGSRRHEDWRAYQRQMNTSPDKRP